MLTGSRQRVSAATTGRSRLARKAALALLFGSCAAVTATAVAQPAPPAAAGPAAEPAAEAAAEAPASGEAVIRLSSRNEQIKVVERFTKVVTLPDRIARVDGFDQEVIDVTALDSRSIRLHAKAPGVTTMTLLDENDQTYSVDVLVVGDVRHLQELLTRLFPTAAIEVVEVRESVVLRGWVTQPSQITEIVEIAEQFYPRVLNQMQVGCVQQVMMKVKVMEVQRSKLRHLGFNFDYATSTGFLFGIPGVIAPGADIGQGVGLIGGKANSFGGTTIGFGLLGDNHSFNGYVEALKQENLLKILAEPNLMTMNGRPANLLAGGEFPILVPNGLGTVGVQYKPFGVRLEAVPLVLSNERVRIELQSEVSDRDLNNSVELQGFKVPALTQRRANTQVELNFGETLIIAGLISQNQTGSTSKVPVLGDLPYVGAAFRRVNYSENETELVIMVTPELVAPMTPDQLPPGGPGLFTDTPTDRELYGYGLLEVPSFGPRCAGAECPPPLPVYDPYHPTGDEHMLAPGGMLPPSGPYPAPPSMMPPNPPMMPATPMMMPPRPMIPPPAAPAGADGSTATAPAAVPNFPPPAPSSAAINNGGRRPTAGLSRNNSSITPVGYTAPANRTASRPGLIEPSRQ